jgi:hypothetical protein
MRKADEDSSTVQLSIRVPKNWPARAEEIAKKLSEPGMTWTRMDALRSALEIGFKSLEKKKKRSG